jgi:hypothetical protein
MRVFICSIDLTTDCLVEGRSLELRFLGAGFHMNTADWPVGPQEACSLYLIAGDL